MAKRPKLVLIDGKAVFHRAYHALANLSSPDGVPTGGVYGFAQMTLKAYADLKPDYAILCWDKAKTALSRRIAIYDGYKAKRLKMPDDFHAQLPYVRQFAQAMGLPLVELDGYEADDIIGTIVAQADANLDIIIVTNDRDIFQLLDDHPHVSVYMQRRGMTDTEIFDSTKARAKYGLEPGQVVDYKALAGDASDNIPGVAGVGDKTALELLSQYKDLDMIYANLADMPEKLQAKLDKSRHQAFMSRQLATIMLDAPYKLNLDDAKTGSIDRIALRDLFRHLGMKSLLDKLPGENGVAQSSLFGQAAGPVKRGHIEQATYTRIDSQEKLQQLVKKLEQQSAFAFDVETDSLDTLTANLVGLSFSFQEQEAYYVPVGHRDKPAGSLLAGQLPLEAVIKALKPILEAKKTAKVGHNIKFDYQVMRRYGIAVSPLGFDTMIAAFLLNPLARTQTLGDLAFRELGIEMIPIEELIGPRGKNQSSFDLVDLDKATSYAAEDADITWRLYRKLKPQISKQGLAQLAEEIEWPLIPVLAEMELTGILLDKGFLKQLDKTVSKKILEHEQTIYKLAGERFNISSPAQLSSILYGKLGLAPAGVRRGKSGSMSTAAKELEKMRGSHPVIDHLFEYRELVKLKTTYIDTLPRQTGQDDRVHTSFSQTIAQTGRLSSTSPNLQNIPVRTELGQKIRRAFIAPPGKALVSADYSQFELRIAASLSGDSNMIKAFKEGTDIHRQTAAELFMIPLDKVTKDQRYAAKTVNFGVLYGMGSHGLSVATGMTHEEAKAFIERYYELRPALAKFIKDVIGQAHEQEYTETIFGRRRPCPEINSNNHMLSSAAERYAFNMVIQGTQADLMKLAMVKLAPKLEGKAQVLLQIHDELIAECDQKDAQAIAKLMKDTMDNSYRLDVPIKTETAIGKNWEELK